MFFPDMLQLLLALACFFLLYYCFDCLLAFTGNSLGFVSIACSSSSGRTSWQAPSGIALPTEEKSACQHPVQRTSASLQNSLASWATIPFIP